MGVFIFWRKRWDSLGALLRAPTRPRRRKRAPGAFPSVRYADSLLFESLRFYIKSVRRPSGALRFWRKRWDSNPRDLAIYLISSQARYDHFDTLPYINFSSTGGARKRPRFDTLPCYPPRFPRGHELFYFIPRRLSSVFTLFLSARVPFFRFSPAPDGLTNIFQNFFVTLLD